MAVEIVEEDGQHNEGHTENHFEHHMVVGRHDNIILDLLRQE